MATQSDPLISRDSDVENRTHITSEDTPLLGDHLSEEEPDATDQKEEPEPKRATWYIWRAFWFVAGALVLAVFIKGWIDAGSDVNVGYPRPPLSLRLISALLV